MMPVKVVALIALLFPGVACAQTIGIDDLDPTSGSIAVTFFGTAPHTSLNIYSVSALRERGICGGATLTDLAVLPYLIPGGALSGTYSAPQALVQIGHVISSPQASGFGANLIAPITVHGPGSGAYSFPWTMSTFTSLPGFGAAGFVWDGAHDIGILYGSPAATGGFLARACTQRRHLAGAFPPVPGSGIDGVGALKLRLTFTLGQPCATKSSTGTGCYRRAWSFYESFPNLAGFDLPGSAANTTVLRGTPTTAGFTISSAPSAWFTPANGPLLANGGTGVMGDDSLSEPLPLPFSFPFPGGTTTSIHAASNGFLLLAPSASTTSSPTPTVAAMLSGQPRLLPLWADLDPTPAIGTARGMYFDVDPSNQAVYLSWVDCIDSRGAPGVLPTSINMQCVLRSSGEFEFRYRGVTADPTKVGGAIVGWSQASAFGGITVDPGSVDLSQSIPFSTSGPDALPLALDATPPAFGATWRLTIRPITGLVPAALLFFGTGSLPGPDLGAIGGPGCRAYSTADITSITLPTISGVATATTTVPTNPQLLGVSFTAQAGAFTFLNPLGLLTSNGMQFVVGN